MTKETANETVDADTVADNTSQKKAGRPRHESIKITREARQRLDVLAAENADDLFRAILGAALAGDMSAARILADRVWPSRRGSPVVFTAPKIMQPADIAPAYAWLLEEVSTGRMTPDEGALIDTMIERRGKAFELIILAQEVDDLRSQLQSIMGVRLAA